MPLTSVRSISSRSRSAVEHAPLVAGQLDVDVELEPAKASPARCSSASSSAQRPGASACPRSRAPRAAARSPSGCSLSTSSSIMSTPWRRAASKLASVLPGSMCAAPLCPTRRGPAGERSAHHGAEGQPCAGPSRSRARSAPPPAGSRSPARRRSARARASAPCPRARPRRAPRAPPAAARPVGDGRPRARLRGSAISVIRLAPAALHVQRRLVADQHDVGAGDPRRAALLALAPRPRQRRPVRLRRVGRGDHQRGSPGSARARRRSTAPGQRELRAAHALDEVAAPADAERLEVGEGVVQQREAALMPSARTCSRVTIP